jgi:hypothetical protein
LFAFLLGGGIEALKAEMVMIVVGEMAREVMVGVVVTVAVVRSDP